MNNIDHNILAYNAAMFAAIFGAPALHPQLDSRLSFSEPSFSSFSEPSSLSFSGLTRESTPTKGQADE